jgi:hypothetical protein
LVSFLVFYFLSFLLRYAINELELKAIQWKYYKENETERHRLELKEKQKENQRKRKPEENVKSKQLKNDNKEKKKEVINLIDDDEEEIGEIIEKEEDNDDIELIDTEDEENDDIRNKKRKKSQVNEKKGSKNHKKSSKKQTRNSKPFLQSDVDDEEVKDDNNDIKQDFLDIVDEKQNGKKLTEDQFLLSLSSFSSIHNNHKENHENPVFRDSQYSRLHCIAKFLHAKLNLFGYCDCEYDESILKSSLSSDYLLSTLEANSISNIENVMNAAAIPIQSVTSNPDEQSLSVIGAMYSAYHLFSDNDIWLSR